MTPKLYPRMRNVRSFGQTRRPDLVRNSDNFSLFSSPVSPAAQRTEKKEIYSTKRLSKHLITGSRSLLDFFRSLILFPFPLFLSSNVHINKQSITARFPNCFPSIVHPIFNTCVGFDRTNTRIFRHTEHRFLSSIYTEYS